MTKPENMADTGNSDGVTKDPELTEAQIAALDGDLNGAAGGSLKKAAKPVAKPAAGVVVKKGKPGPTAEELGNNPAQLVIARVTSKGDKRVHDGSGARFDAGDEVVLELGVAQALRGDPTDKKARGYVEILSKA